MALAKVKKGGAIGAFIGQASAERPFIAKTPCGRFDDS
jgi:hypothetical protein